MEEKFAKQKDVALTQLKDEIDNKVRSIELASKKHIEELQYKDDLFAEIVTPTNYNDVNVRLLKVISEEIGNIILMPTQSFSYKKHDYNIKNANEHYKQYDDAFNDVLNKLDNAIDASFVDGFNHAFNAKNICSITNKNFLGFCTFKRRENENDMEYTKKAIIGYLMDYLYQLREDGVNCGIERINEIWVNKKEYGNIRIQEDKYHSLFLLEYVIEQMFPNDEERFRNMNKFTHLAIKLNASESEWKLII